MRIAYWDCFSGISGDMALGALIDAGLDVARLREELDKLGVPGWELEARRDVRYGISGTQARVLTTPQHEHRHLRDIQQIIGNSTLAVDVQERALAVFRRLAEAEGAVHGMPADEVHFHEVGALDAIVDVVGVVVGLKLLGVVEVFASPLPLGSGWINAAHGRIPVPGPAVVRLLADVAAPLSSDDTPFELVTPTGAALLAEVATFKRPPIKIQGTGYGFGTRDTGRLNAVRVWLGEPVEPKIAVDADALGPGRQQVLLLETNIDDQPGEQLAYVVEQMLRQGALDAWWQPIGMKKGRPAILLSVLAPPEHEQGIVATLFSETTSLGVRRQLIDRWVCEREVHSVETAWGVVRIKIKRWQGALLGFAPEYEDCAAIARRQGVPLHTVYAAAQRAGYEQEPGAGSIARRESTGE